MKERKGGNAQHHLLRRVLSACTRTIYVVGELRLVVKTGETKSHLHSAVG